MRDTYPDCSATLTAAETRRCVPFDRSSSRSGSSFRTTRHDADRAQSGCSRVLAALAQEADAARAG